MSTTKAWICPKCKTMNAGAVARCKCGAKKPPPVKVTQGVIGPKHDPYSRTIYEAIVSGPHLEPWHLRLVCCSLTGTTLEVNGVAQSNIWRGQPDPNHTMEEFERLVGRTLDDINHHAEVISDPFGHPTKFI